MVTVACAAATGRNSRVGLRTPTGIIRREVVPGRSASKVKETSLPLPDTPPLSGGRVSVMVAFPDCSSIRWTTAIVCPSRPRKLPFLTF